MILSVLESSMSFFVLHDYITYKRRIKEKEKLYIVTIVLKYRKKLS